MPSMGYLALLFILSTAAKWFFIPVFLENFKIFPHFTSPLNDLRELKESFYIYETSGKFFAGPTDVGQSELLLKLLYAIYSPTKNDLRLHLFIAFFESVSVILQLVIFHKVFSITQKKENYVNLALFWIFFNPFSLVSGYSNIGAVNNCFWYALCLAPLTKRFKQSVIQVSTLSAIAVYFDPRIIFLLLPLTVIQQGFKRKQDCGNFFGIQNKKGTFRRIILTYAFVAIVHSVFTSQTQMDNITNIMMINNPTESLGPFWYIMHEIFIQYVPYFKVAYLVMQGLMCIFVSQMLYATADFVDLIESKNQQPREKCASRRQRLYMTGLFLISFIKFVMNAYPNLHDVSVIIFFMLMSITFVMNYVEGFYFLLAGLVFGISNSVFLWITWLERFSGNANFFFFQAIVVKAFLVLLFIQVFMGLDSKRKKYTRELCQESVKEKTQ